MERRSLYDIIRALNEAEVRFLITGGLAVVAHGYVRFTANVDLLIDATPDSSQRALRALGELGYEPTSEFRHGMSALELRSPRNAQTPVLLVADPKVDFEHAYRASAIMEAAPDVQLRFVSKVDLIASKRPPTRTLDSVDMEKLESLPEDGADAPPVTEEEWPVGWEGHERDQLERTSRLPLSAKLQWLEEAQELVLALQRRKPADPTN